MAMVTLSVNPLVSVIVPSYNQGRFIKQTIDSILAQEYRPLEIIVIDGASKDNTVDVLHQYDDVPEVKWISEADSGVVEAVNKGFAQARGEIGAIQSSDDYYLPGAISGAVGALKENPAAGLVYGDIVKVDAQGGELSRTQLAPFTLEDFLSIKTWIPQPSAFFRLELAKSLCGWRQEMPYAADTDLWLRMAFKADIRKIDALFSARRVHEEQRDREAARIAHDYSLMIDSSGDLKLASGRVRRAAVAGKYLMRVRYNASGSDFRAALNLLRAGLIYPRSFDIRRLYYSTVYFPTRKALSKGKRLFANFFAGTG